MIIDIDKRVMVWPTSWEDVSDAGRVKLAELVVRMQTDESTVMGMLWSKVLRVLVCDAEGSEMDKRSADAWYEELVLTEEQVLAWINASKWVLERPKGRMLERFRWYGEWYEVVGERWENTEAGEFTYGLMDYIDLVKGGELAAGALERLVANFCRPKREDAADWRMSYEYNGDDRVPYNRAKAEEVAETFSELKEGIKILVLWWLDEMYKGHLAEYEEVYGGNGNDDGARYADGRGHMMVLKTVAKAGHIGNLGEVMKTDVNMVYGLLLDDVYDARDMEKNMK